MKKHWKIVLAVLTTLILIAVWRINTPVDIRPDLIGKEISEAAYQKGAELIKEMQNAYGGMEHWLAFEKGHYAQVANWYDDKLGVNGWDTIPQAFQMSSVLGTDDAEMTILNGPNAGETWGVENFASYRINEDKSTTIQPHEQYQHKLLYKNYWFQFPFRIHEASYIAYAGEAELEGQSYDLLYATWGSESANRTYDQYVMYLNKETRLVEWLHFTLREKLKPIHLTARFTNFKTINGINLPYSQYLTIGRPGNPRFKMHENHYQWIQFGDVRVER